MRKGRLIGHRGSGKLNLIRMLAEQCRIQVIEAEKLEKAKRELLMIGSGLGTFKIDIDELCRDARPTLEKRKSWHELNKRHISKKQRRKL